MDLVDLARRRRRLLFFAAASVAAGYGAYRLYNHPTVVRKRVALARLAGALESISDATAFSADTVALLSHDLNHFLRVGGEIPPSLRQLARLTSSGEVSASVSRLSQAVTLGVLLGHRHATPPADPNSKGLADRVLDKLFSGPGADVASAVAGSFAKNLVVGFYSREPDSNSNSKSGLPESDQPVPKWVNLVCSEPCKDTITDVVQSFVSTAVSVFLDKTMHMNTFDDVFSGLTNPKHEQKMKEMLVSVCNGAVETLVKTSHDVMTKQGTGTGNGSNLNKVELTKPSNSKQSDKSGWVDTVSSTLSVPSNRRFVLDVTGRVTFETVRSCLEFVLWKIIESGRSGASAIREEALEVMRYLSAKSMLVVTICVSLCMHVMSGTRVLVPA